MKVLVFRIGQLGDTIVALPAMWAARRHLPGAHFTLLCDRHPGGSRVLAADLLKGAGLFEEFASYPVHQSASGRCLRWLRMLCLLGRLRKDRFQVLLYLAPSTRQPPQVLRDRRFFAAAGIKRLLGFHGFSPLPQKTPGRPLDATLAESDLLLARLAADGIPVPERGEGSLELGLGDAEEQEVSAWLSRQVEDNGRLWVGLGPGSKMPAKRWPVDRFQEVALRLVRKFNVWPVIFGGREDHALGEQLLSAVGAGYNGAGALSLRASAAALRRCALYVGNDTGTMHLAAAVRVPCVAVFSAREWPGMWHPYGVPARVLRSSLECEGCGLVSCIEKQNECLTRISVDQVFNAASEFLTSRLSPRPVKAEPGNTHATPRPLRS